MLNEIVHYTSGPKRCIGYPQWDVSAPHQRRVAMGGWCDANGQLEFQYGTQSEIRTGATVPTAGRGVVEAQANPLLTLYWAAEGQQETHTERRSAQGNRADNRLVPEEAQERARDRLQTDRLQTDRRQTDRLQANRHQADDRTIDRQTLYYRTICYIIVLCTISSTVLISRVIIRVPRVIICHLFGALLLSRLVPPV